jgi:hypothetical protein
MSALGHYNDPFASCRVWAPPGLLPAGLLPLGCNDAVQSKERDRRRPRPNSPMLLQHRDRSEFSSSSIQPRGAYATVAA